MDELPPYFTHLHVHSHYSLLGGTAAVADLVARAVAEGRRALALTDSRALYGAVALHKACRAANLQPIVGLTLPIATPAEDLAEQRSPGQLVLLAQNPAGYRSLCRLASQLDGAQPVELGLLRDFSEGVIALDGGRRGWLSRFVRAGNTAAAVRYASRLAAIFQENGYLGVELTAVTPRHPLQELLKIGNRFGLAPVALQPVYCLQPDDRELLRLLTAVSHNCTLNDLTPAMLPDEGETAVDLHWLAPDEMLARYATLPDALTNAAAIVKQCEPALPNGRSIWPALKLPEGQSSDDALAEWVRVGLGDFFPSGLDAAGEQRLRRELEAIRARGLAPLFLVVADIVGFARQLDIPVNTRGSVANSLVAYCLGITTINPLSHDLLFERFLNPARANLPDIDLDFCSRRRDEVLDYVRQTYGEDRVALVATVNTLKPKSAVREVAKAFGLPESRIGKLAGLVPHHYWHPDPRRREGTGLEGLLAQLDDPQEQAIFLLAFQLIGQPDHLSVHPGGIVITPGPLTDVVPVQMAPKGFLITQYDYRDVEEIGLPKIDLLGIRALTVLADAAELVRTHHVPSFRLGQIEQGDEKTAVLLATADTIGVFQCESTGAQRTLRQLRARSVADLAIANAFFKPGPATGGMAKSFVRRYRGEEAVAYLHPALQPILGKTQGVLLFQEQILRIATEIAGLSWQEADHLRRGMSKFLAREMAALRTRFVAGCQRQAGFTPEQAETLWQQVMAFAGYGFNQGHATAYAAVSYESAYLKAHWPAEFLCARLADAGGFHHQAIYVAEARRLGIEVRPPHVNASGGKFVLSYGERGGWGVGSGGWGVERGEMEHPTPYTPHPTLWMGLGQIRDLRQTSITAIRAERPFASLRDLLARVPLQEKEVVHLIQCGALDGLGASRAALLAEARSVMRAGSARQLSFGFAVETAVLPDTAAERSEWEHHMLGYPVSVQPGDLVAPPAGAVALRDLTQTGGKLVTVAGWRLPGWTGGRGYYFGDGDSFVVVREEGEKGRKSWQPVVLNGRWRSDEWGNGVFQVG